MYGLHRNVYTDAGVSVMASGMGMPSMGIYSATSYIMYYDVDNIIRIGSAGSISDDGLDLKGYCA